MMLILMVMNGGLYILNESCIINNRHLIHDGRHTPNHPLMNYTCHQDDILWLMTVSDD